MALQDVLAARGLTTAQAKVAVTALLSQPKVVYDIINATGVSFAELGSLINYTKPQVQDYFAKANLGSTVTALANIGFTQGEARAIVNSTLDAGGTAQVFDVTKALGLKVQALAEVSGRYSVAQLESKFIAAGINPGEIGGTPWSPAGGSAGGGSVATTAFVSADFLPLASVIVSFNGNTGALSNAALKAAVLQRGVSEQAYNAFFSPSHYIGSADGVFTPAELGFSHLGSINATSANIESIYYGSVIKAFNAIDQSEGFQLSSYVQSHQAPLAAGNAAAIKEYTSLLASIFQSPANPPLIPAATLATTLADTTALVIKTVGTNGSALFDSGSLFGFGG